MSDEKKPLTKWEAGNELVKAFDALTVAKVELKDYPHLQEIILQARQIIQTRFNVELKNEMGFGL